MDGRRTWIPWTLVIALLVLTAGSAVLSVTATKPGPARATNVPVPVAPITGFGGYHVAGNTTTIGARWTVPKIQGTVHRSQEAATWIGAQGISTDSFVQVGTLELRLASGASKYVAFWSDFSLHFRAQFIGNVGADDAMSATMTRSPKGWDLHIADLTSNWSHTVQTGYGGGGLFTQGEWIEEDPAPSYESSHDLPYPATTVVRFTDLTYNGGTPPLSYDDATALSAYGGIYLVPTPVSDDSFSLPPAQGAARQYLVDANQYDSVEASVAVVVTSTTGPLSAAAQRRVVGRLIAAFGSLNRRLLSQSWPSSVAPEIPILVHADTAVMHDDGVLEDKGFKVSLAASQRFTANDRQFEAAVEAVRSELGLPPT